MVNEARTPTELFEDLWCHEALLDVPKETLEDILCDELNVSDLTAYSEKFKLKKDLITSLENALNRKIQTLKILVRAYSQMCLRCNRVSDIGLYSDETERIAQAFAKRYVGKRFDYTEEKVNKPEKPL